MDIERAKEASRLLIQLKDAEFVYVGLTQRKSFGLTIKGGDVNIYIEPTIAQAMIEGVQNYISEIEARIELL